MTESSHHRVAWKPVRYPDQLSSPRSRPPVTHSRSVNSAYDLTGSSSYGVVMPHYYQTSFLSSQGLRSTTRKASLSTGDLVNDIGGYYNMSTLQAAGHYDEFIRPRMVSETLPFGAAREHRNSSVYSTDSASSNSTANTTISDIFEFYGSLSPLKIGKDAGSHENLNNNNDGDDDHNKKIQPQSYRDTLIPLLKHRFSSESLVQPRASAVTAGSFASSYTRSPASEVTRPPTSSPGHAVPSFKDFQRNLQQQRRLRESAMESRGRTERLNAGLSSRISASSPPSVAEIRARARSMPRMKAIDYPIPYDDEIVPRPLNISRRRSRESTVITRQSTQSGTHNPQYDDYDFNNVWYPDTSFDFRAGTRTTFRESDERARPDSIQPTRRQTLYERPNLTTDVWQDPILRRSSGTRGSQRKLQKRNGQSQEIIPDQSNTSPSRRSASARRPNHEKSWSDNRPNSMKTGVNALVRRLSTPSLSRNRVPPVPQLPIQHPAIPFSAYQLHGPKVLEEQIKQELKEERRRAKADLKLEKARRSLEERVISGHRRTVSAKSTSSIGSMFEGLKHSLTRSSSERRREKLKASIVVIGPATLTAENSAFQGMI